jgi:ribose transport system substrate-binding protein
MTLDRCARRLPRLRSLALMVGLGLIASACVSADRDVSTGSATPGQDGNPATSADATAPGASAVPSSVPATSLPEPSQAPATVPPRSMEPSLGYISLDESVPFVQVVSAGIRDAAATAGIKLVECDPAWSRTGVRNCAAELAQAGVHGLISFQPFPDLTADVCAATGDAPIVGVVFDQGPCQVAQLSIDQAESGRLAGDAMGAFAAERWDCVINSYISLESGDADPDGRARMQGYRDGFAQHCPLPEQAITLDGADRLATAQTQVSGLLDELKGKPNLVVGLNEDAILGAMAAVSRADRSSQFWYSGQLADPSIRQHIACDEQYVASVAQFPDRFGAPLVATLMDALADRTVAPVMEAELQVVTADNVLELFPDTPACGE